jgi:hypothetical protein
MNINFDLIDKIKLQLAARKLSWDSHFIYAVCHERTGGFPTVPAAKMDLEKSIICVGTGVPPHAVDELFQDSNGGSFVYTFDKLVWNDLKAYSMLNPIQRVLLSCRIGVIAKLAKHLLLYPLRERVKPRDEWFGHARAWMSSIDCQIGMLIDDIELEMYDSSFKVEGEKVKVTYINGISRLYNGADYFQPYVHSLDMIAKQARANGKQKAEVNNRSPFNGGSGSGSGISQGLVNTSDGALAD